MTVFSIVALLVVGAFSVAMLNSFAEEGDGKDNVVLCTLLIFVFLGMGAFVAHESGTGKLSAYPLDQNAIYETLSSAPDGAGKYAVILKGQDGSLSAYVLAQDPPKMFKYTGDEKNPYQPFPPVPPTK